MLRIRNAWFHRVSGDGTIDPGSPDTVLHPADTGDSDTRAVANLAAGDYEVEFFWWERGGGDYGELYAAKGSFSNDEDTDTWVLIGDAGGLPLVDPGTPAPGEDFRITSVARTADPASVTLTFSADPARTYAVEYSLNLTTWQDTGAPVQPEGGAVPATVTIPLTAPPLLNAPAVYLRVRANP